MIGIDPGINGGFVYLSDNGEVQDYYVIPRIGNEVDIKKFAQILGENGLDTVCLENVHALHGVSAKSTSSFMRTLGIIEGVLTALNFPYFKVTPKEWQKEMLVGIPKIIKGKTKTGKDKTDVKAMSLLAKQRLFPTITLKATERCKIEHDGLIDALLIAEYGRRKIPFGLKFMR